MTDVTFLQSLKIIGRGAFSIALGALIGLTLAYIFLSFLTPHYRGSMIIGPVDSRTRDVVRSPVAEDNLYAARYVTQRQEGANGSDFLRFETIVSGVSVAAALLQREDVRAGLAADTGSRFAEKDIEGTWSPPALAQYLKKHVRLDPVGETALRTMIYYHPDPEFAAHFLRIVHGVTDTLIRRDAKTNTDLRIDYLKSALAKTHNPEHRRTFTALLLEQERLRMLVSIESDYAASVIEPPASSYKPLWPSRPLVIGAFLLLGALIGFFLHYGRRDPTTRF